MLKRPNNEPWWRTDHLINIQTCITGITQTTICELLRTYSFRRTLFGPLEVLGTLELPDFGALEVLGPLEPLFGVLLPLRLRRRAFGPLELVVDLGDLLTSVDLGALELVLGDFEPSFEVFGALELPSRSRVSRGASTKKKPSSGLFRSMRAGSCLALSDCFP